MSASSGRSYEVRRSKCETATKRVHVRVWARIPVALVVLLLTLAAGPRASMALEVEEVTSRGGIRAWLAPAPGSPLVALHFAFMGGSMQDPVGKEGVAALLAAMLGEGAGTLGGSNFRAAAARSGLRIEFSASRDALLGTAEFQKDKATEALGLLRLALLEPHFDEADFARVRSGMLAENATTARDQRAIAHRRWHEHAFEGRDYARPAEGSEESLARIGPSDLVEYRQRLLSLGALRVVVVGDLTAIACSDLLDKVFASLPIEIAFVPPRTVLPRRGNGTVAVTGDFAQSLAVMGLPFAQPQDPALPAALVLQRILGGDHLEARLLTELRVLRRLAYAASIELAGDSYSSLLKGEVVTAPDRIDEAISALFSVLVGLVDAGPTVDEVESAKSYLIGSFPLSFDSSRQIAANLLSLRLAGHRPDYLAQRAAALAAVTRDDVHRVARKWLEPDAVSVVVVGPDDRPR